MKAGKRVLAVILAAAMIIAVPQVSAQAASKGYAFTSNGAKAYINGKASSFLKKQGKAQSVKKVKSCAYKGEDITYTFRDYTLTTYSKKKGSTEYIQNISFSTKSAKTDKGIHIGSTERQMKSKYGRQRDNFGIYTYKKGKMAIKFRVSDGKVKEISYAAL